jgi:16S rRNA (uracil1498-N3)-methyltransferase
MKHRLFVEGPLSLDSVVALDGDERHHARVLRVREGEEVELFNGQGSVYVARYESPDSIRVIAEAPNREPGTAIHLAMAIIQLDNFELVLQKGTEIGVASFIPLITDRIEVRPERYRGKEERWKKIVFEAVKQSGRSKIPIIEPAAKFDEVMKRPGAKIIFDADAEASTGQPDNPTTLFIGPEGGWSERELGLARQQGAAWQRLGIRRLRAETAAIVAAAITSARSGDI